MRGFTNIFFKSILLFATYYSDGKTACLWIWQSLCRIFSRIFKRLFVSSETKDKKQYVWQWANILPGVPQDSILGTLLFNIFLCLIGSVSYADDNTPFTIGISEMEVINEIMIAAESLSLWFQNIVWKWIQLNFTFFLVTEKLIRWISVQINS